MSDLMNAYWPLVLFVAVAAVVAAGAAVLSFLLGRQNPSKEKNEPYECGFLPFSDARARFPVRFYLISLLFIVFDLEVAFLFPWAVTLKEIGWPGFISMLVFLGVLTVGFVYEWMKGAMEWD